MEITDQTTNQMKRQYEDIPQQGEHRKGSIEEEPSTNVRAQDPVLPTERSKTHRNEPLRVRIWKRGDGDGFEELEHFESDGDYQKALEKLPSERRYVVFENTGTGEVYYDEESDLGGDWTGEGRFDQVTIFEDGAEAARYVEKRSEA